MSIWGKILVFFNLVMAVVVLAIGSMDYGKRQAWRYAYQLHRFAVNGLPVDGREKDTKEPREDPIVADVTDGMAKEIFAKAGGGNLLGGQPVKTVADELARVNALVSGKITSKQDAKALVLPLARTLGERTEVIAMIDGDDANMSKTKGWFAEQVRAASRTATSPPNNKELRLNMGHVLVNLSTDTDWRVRCMTVLGMEAYLEVVGRQADALVAMAVDVERAMMNDRATFERQHMDLVQAILKEADELHKAKGYLEELQKTAAERQTQLAQRTTEKQEEDNKLAQAKADADTAIAKLKAVQKDLFALQQRKGTALQKNQQLESELRQMETKR